MPAGDGDRPAPGGEQELVAEIIPLRRRAPAWQADEEPTAGGGFGVGREARSSDTSNAGERSVWEPPTGQLRRREDPAHPRPSRRLPRRTSRRFLVGAAGLALCAVLAAVTLGVLRPGNQANRMGAQIEAPATSGEVQPAVSQAQKKPSARSGVASKRERAAKRTPDRRHARKAASSRQTSRSSPPAATPARSEAAEDVEVSSPPVEASPPASAPDTSDVSSETEEATSAPSASGQPATQESVQTPASSSSASSTDQDECVPGELGC